MSMIRNWAAAGMAGALLAASGMAAQAASPEELAMKGLGTTENLGAVITETLRHAAMELTPAQRELALKCYRENVCETGQGDITIAYADGFGENVWRQVTKMEFIAQALTYPNVKKIIYSSAAGDASKAVSDMRAFIAQDVDVIVMFADAGAALLPTVKEATAAGILVTVHNGTDVGGEAGVDYVTAIAENICKLGESFVDIIAKNAAGDPASVVFLGGTPGNPLSATWQKCAQDVIGSQPKLKLLGTADTNWTQEGTFEAMSGFLAQNDTVDAVAYEYADGFRGGVRAYESAGKEPNVVVALRTDEQGLFCDWEKINDPDFKIFYSSGQNYQSRIALTAAMMKHEGQEVPARIDVPFSMKQVKAGQCNPALPQDASVSTMLDDEMMQAMFAQ